MRTHIRLGRLLGVPIGLNWGVLAVCVLLTVSLAQLSLPSIAPDHPASAYWFAGVIGVIGFLVSLTGHELGHSYVAARNDVKVVEITLWLFGGVAKLEGDADNPGAEFRIAAAGPAMSMVMAGLFGAAWWGLERLGGSAVLGALLVWLALINVVLAVSNLLPAFPLDGGRMLRAILWRRSHRKIAATRTAALWGQILAVGLVLASIALIIWVSRWSGFWTLLLAVFLLVAARSEWHTTPRRARSCCSARSPGSAGRCLPRSGATPRSRSSSAPSPGTPAPPMVPVYDENGQVSALVLPDAIMRVPPAQRAVVPIASLTEPLWSLPRVHPEESVRQVLDRLGSGTYWRAVVTDGASMEGVLCSEDVERVVELASA
jgi:Zn-dependent protease